MKLLIVTLPLITLMAGWFWTNPGFFSKPSPPGISFPGTEIASDTVDFDQQQAVAELRERIEGQEERPSSEVFENIEVFEKVPAERLLRIMEMGFTRSLGVNCTHCHNPKDWASEEKPQKQIAREMMAMAGRINSELLANIKNLESEKPTVNCTTCHRGEVIPALNLE